MARRRARKVRATELQDLLATTSTTTERIRGLLAVLHAEEVAEVLETNVSTLRNWGAGQSKPKPQVMIALDDLRTTVKVLLDAGLNPERARAWLLGLDPDGPFGQTRPIDNLSQAPMDVLSEAQGVALNERLSSAA